MKKLMNQKGFTLIELLLVVVVMGLMLAVIVPRGQRATTDAKYNLCRQVGTELSKMAQDWSHTELAGQDEDTSTASLADYYAYPTGTASAEAGTALAKFVAISTTNRSWRTAANPITGRIVGGVANQAPSGSIVETRIVDKVLVNPFNGLSVFVNQNSPDDVGEAIPGAFSYGYIADNSQGSGGGANSQWYYYGITFQGTESVDALANDMQGNMNADTLEGLRNGIMVARVQDQN